MLVVVSVIHPTILQLWMREVVVQKIQTAVIQLNRTVDPLLHLKVVVQKIQTAVIQLNQTVDPLLHRHRRLNLPITARFDKIDNDGDGKIDQLDEDCGGGGPGVPTFPGGGAATPGNNRKGEFDLGIGLVSNRNGPPTILSSAFETAIRAGEAQAGEREHLCDDGIDNDHNSLTDFQDPSCGGAGISALGFKGPPPRTASIKFTGFAENQTSLHKGISGIISSGTNQSNSSVISIYGGSKHDIRTIYHCNTNILHKK